MRPISFKPVRPLGVVILCAALALSFASHAQTTDESRALEIILARNAYSLHGVQFDRLHDVLDLVARVKPTVVRIGVCQSTAQETVAEFKKELAYIYQGSLEIQILSQRAIECGWNRAKEQTLGS